MRWRAGSTHITPTRRQTVTLVDAETPVRSRLRRTMAWLWARPRLPLARWIIGVVVAALAGIVGERVGLAAQIAAATRALGFDAERAWLVGGFVLTLLAAGVSGLLFLRRSAAWTGAVLYFLMSSAWPLYFQAQHPTLGPDGQPQTLIPGALATVMATVIAVGSLLGAIGAALGEATGRLILPPLAVIATRLLARAPRQTTNGVAPSLRSALFALATAAALVATLVIAGAGVTPLLTFGAAPQLYQPAPPPQQERVPKGTTLTTTYTSAALGGATSKISVYLPPSYATQPERRYPVFYLLHGSPGAHTNWFGPGHATTTVDRLIATRAIQDVILIAPDGNGSTYRVAAWANSFDKRQRMEDAISFDLVRFVDERYRTLADAAHRIIGGLSEGGFGAANIALHHPDIFGAVVSLSGFFTADANPVFGASPLATPYRQFNSPAAYIDTPDGQRAAHRLVFVIGVGTADGSFYKSALAFSRRLGALGVEVHYLETSGGHSWAVWASQFGAALRLLPGVATPTTAPHGPPQSLGPLSRGSEARQRSSGTLRA